jgi:hypothetical protein
LEKALETRAFFVTGRPVGKPVGKRTRARVPNGVPKPRGCFTRRAGHHLCSRASRPRIDVGAGRDHVEERTACESERARCGAACERGGNHLPLSASGRRPTAQPSRALIGMQKHDVTCAVEVAALKDVSGSQEMVD